MTAVLIGLLLLLAWVFTRLLRRPGVSPLLTVSLLLYAIMWHFTPVILTLIDGSRFRPLPLVSQDIFIKYAVIETAVFLCCLSFLFVRKPYFPKIVEAGIAQFSISDATAFLLLLFSVLVPLIPAFASANQEMGTSYWDRNAFVVKAAGEETYNTLGSFAFIEGLLTAFGYAYLIVARPRGIRGNALYWFMLAWTLWNIFSEVLLGARLGLIMPFLLLMFRGIYQKWPARRMVQFAGTALIATVIVGSLLSLAITQLRGAYSFQAGDILGASATTVDSSQGMAGVTNSIVEETLKKFDSFSSGAVLVENLGWGTAGWRPYEGVVTALIPRSLLPEKAVPGSVDGTYLGHPSRLVPIIYGANSESLNVGVSPAAIAIWHFGILGLVAMVLCAGLYLFTLNSLLSAPSAVTVGLALALMGPPAFATLFASPDVLLLGLERIMIVFMLLAVMYRVLSHRQVAGYRAERLASVRRVWPDRGDIVR